MFKKTADNFFNLRKYQDKGYPLIRNCMRLLWDISVKDVLNLIMCVKTNDGFEVMLQKTNLALYQLKAYSFCLDYGSYKYLRKCIEAPIRMCVAT